MKKVVTPGVLEEVKYFCDHHPDRECFSEVKTASWYGSNFDLTGCEFHLCDECLKELYEQFNKTYGVKPKDIII
jgi:hypothetical protein